VAVDARGQIVLPVEKLACTVQELLNPVANQLIREKKGIG
jgi:hypothetical protein